MSRRAYDVGDSVLLKDGRFSTSRAGGSFRILHVYADGKGQAEYRVRSDRENFDRRISHEEIDVENSLRPKTKVADAGKSAIGERWFNPHAIKVGK